MKEGWEYKKLGDLGTFVRGGNFSKKDFVENGFPCIHYGQIHMKFGIETFKHISSVPAGMVKPDRCAHKGDLVIAITSEDDAGSCKCTAWMGDYDVYVGGHTAIYRHTMQPKYVSYYFMSPFFQKDKLEYTHGFKVVEISPKDIAKITIPVPPLSEQQSIVDYLDSAFAKIDAMKANAEKALNEAKALFQASLKEMLEPKEGWEEKKLKKIAQIKIGPFGSLLHKKDYISGGVPLVNPIHMVNGHIAIDNNYTISESKAKELSSYLLKENDIVFARRGEIGRCALVGEKENTYLCGTGSLFVRFNQEVDYGFMLLLFQSKYCKEYLEKQATGATMLNINSAIVGDMPIKYPHTNIQQSIVETLDSLKSKVDKLQANYDKISQECDALKQAILRQVFE